MDSKAEKLLAVLEETRELLARPDNDFSWSSWNDGEEALWEIDALMVRVREGDWIEALISVLYAPTGPIQEVSLSSGWGTEFLSLADRIDALLASR